MLRDLDRQAFRADRGALLDQLIEEASVQPVVETDPSGSLRGYALARPGANAIYVGPIVALDEHCARRLLDHLLNRLSGPVCLDSPAPGGALMLSLREHGFARERGLTPMSQGAPTSAGLTPSIHAIAGPETG
jgi:Acetyltransferase (GNAT) domain